MSRIQDPGRYVIILFDDEACLSICLFSLVIYIIMVQNAREKVARQDLRAKTLSVTTKNAKELQNAIEKANQLCLEDKGDLKFAHERLDLLQLQKGTAKIEIEFLLLRRFN